MMEEKRSAAREADRVARSLAPERVRSWVDETGEGVAGEVR